MGYKYEEQRAYVFTEEGQVMFLAIRDKAKELIEIAGAARLLEIIGGQTGDGWNMLACVDRLVELGDLLEIPTQGSGQGRLFVRRAHG